MKKLICFVLAVMLVAAVMPISAGATGFAETESAEKLISDGFESGISSWWRADNGTITLESGVFGRAEADKSAKFEAAGAASFERYVNGAGGSYVALQMSLFIPDMSAERSVVINGDETLLKFAENGDLLSGKENSKIGTYSANRWQNILAVIKTGSAGSVVSGTETYPIANYRIFINGNEAENDGLLTSEIIDSVYEIGLKTGGVCVTYIDSVFVANCGTDVVNSAKDNADFGEGGVLYGSEVYYNGEMPEPDTFSERAASKAKTWFEFSADKMPAGGDIFNTGNGSYLSVSDNVAADNSYALFSSDKAGAPNLRIENISNSIGDAKHFWLEGDFVLNMKAGDRFVPFGVGNNKDSCASLINVYAADEAYADIAAAYNKNAAPTHIAIGKYKMGEKVNLACDVNVAAGTYDIYMNGVLLKKENLITDTNNLGTDSEAIKHFRMTLIKATDNIESNIIIDNIKFFAIDSSGQKTLTKDYACGNGTFKLYANNGAELEYSQGAIDGAKPFSMKYTDANGGAFLKKALNQTGISDVADAILEFDSAFSSLQSGKIWYVGFRFKNSSSKDVGVNLVRFKENNITDANGVNVDTFTLGERKKITAKITEIDAENNKLFYDIYIDGILVKSTEYTPGSWNFSEYNTISEMRCGVANSDKTEALVYNLKMYKEDNATANGVFVLNSDYETAENLSENGYILSVKNGIVNVYGIRSGKGGKTEVTGGAAKAEYESFNSQIIPVFIAGAYDNGGVLKKFGSESFWFDAGHGVFKSSINLGNEEGMSYKAFIWDSLSGMTPVVGN